MKQSTKMFILLISLILITALFFTGTIARLITSTTSGDQARITTWGLNAGNINMDLFANQYELEDDTIIAKSNNGDNIIAPGLNGVSKFNIITAKADIKPEVMYEIIINVDDSNMHELILANPSIQWKLDNNPWGTWEETKYDILALSGDVTGRKIYAPGTVATEFANGKEHTLAWQWLLEGGNDELDTYIGNMAAEEDLNAKISVSITARQTNTTEMEMLEGNFSEYNVNNPEAVVFKADGNIEEFTNVEVNDEIVPSSNYTVESGSIKVTLKESYLNTLGDGNHIITINAGNKKSNGIFKVKKVIPSIPELPEEPNIPEINKNIIPAGGKYYVQVQSPETAYIDYYTQELYISSDYYTEAYFEGDTFPETVQNNDVYIYNNIEYRYNSYISDGADWSTDNSLNGWGIAAYNNIDEILIEINGKPVTSFKNTFLMNWDITSFNMPINNNITNISNMFSGCRNLTGEIEINSTNLTDFSKCLYGTEKPIILTGSSPYLEAIAETANNNNVTVKRTGGTSQTPTTKNKTFTLKNISDNTIIGNYQYNENDTWMQFINDNYISFISVDSNSVLFILTNPSPTTTIYSNTTKTKVKPTDKITQETYYIDYDLNTALSLTITNLYNNQNITCSYKIGQTWDELMQTCDFIGTYGDEFIYAGGASGWTFIYADEAMTLIQKRTDKITKNKYFYYMDSMI